MVRSVILFSTSNLFSSQVFGHPYQFPITLRQERELVSRLRVTSTDHGWPTTHPVSSHALRLD